MAEAGLPDFKTGGALWFTDLSAVDPTYVLPGLSSLATLAVLQVCFGSELYGELTLTDAFSLRSVNSVPPKRKELQKPFDPPSSFQYQSFSGSLRISRVFVASSFLLECLKLN
jgi:hypothetical protein